MAFLSPDGARLVLGPNQKHASSGSAFDERTTVLDHVGPRAGSLEDLYAWPVRTAELGTKNSPVAEAGSGSVPGFRDPDNVQFEARWPEPSRQPPRWLSSMRLAPGLPRLIRSGWSRTG